MTDTVREVCKCGHDKATHHAISEQRPARFGKGFEVVVTLYRSCLATFCSCERYEHDEYK